MTFVIIVVVLVACILILAFVVYPWCTKDENQTLDKASQIIVEVWYYDSADKVWKFWEDVTMADWMMKNGRYFSEVDPNLVEKYAFANWIAWKDDSSLPKPAEYINRDDFEAMYKPDLSGPYGCSLFDDQVVR